ncbi:MAG: PfkB family carbohydrate kinase [Rhodobacteraceae bacterium]|nr:PfkB family carbohydrate kinase [Paracoccaceae bacterium]
MSRARLVQLSGVIVDLVFRVEAVPAPGSEAVTHGIAVTAGGGFNAMLAARRFGMEVLYAGSLGTGPFASIAAEALAAAGIRTLRPPRRDADQGLCVTLVDASGERTFIAREGADGLLEDADLASLAPAAADRLLLSGYALAYAGSRAALARWLSAGAAGAGAGLLFDPGPLVARLDPAVLGSALAAATWVSANRAEAAVLTGCADPAAAAEALAASRPAGGGAVVRAGAEGAFLALTGGRARHVPGHAVAAVDTSGAGDTHVGAFLARLAAGDGPERAVRLANIAAALSVTRPGPATAPTLAEVRAVAGDRGFDPGV